LLLLEETWQDGTRVITKAVNDMKTGGCNFSLPRRKL